MSNLKYILVNGYGWSGSSALVDFFREFDGAYVPQKEFRLIKDPHGIRDLDMQLNNSIDALNEDVAIKDFIKFIKIYSRVSGGFRPLGLSYSTEFGKDIEKISLEFISDLVDYQYTGHWWYLDIGMQHSIYIAKKILAKLKIYDYKEHTKMFLSNITEETFLKKVKEYIDCIFANALMNNDCNMIVLDQAIPANRSTWGERYFSNAKVLVVDRDPRDVYVDLIKEKSLVGYDVAVNHDVNLFIDWFKKVRCVDSVSANYMRVQFEDLILNYDSTIESIYEFCGISSDEHIHKKTRLVPEESSKNIGMWRKHPYPEEIRKIEQELKEYLVQ